tara:strand:+ start:57 stop:746 length:690 start_codon:yes stop_codon:yes gene_type:complete
MISNVEKRWNKALLNKNNNDGYPSEYLIRIFKGDYPKLKLSKNSFLKKKICDISCGGGRNLTFLNACGFDTYGTEISQTIVNNTKKNLSKFNIKPVLKVGNNSTINFKDNFFDYLLSWSAIYYMGETLDFNSHVNEHARVLKKNGYLVMSIPQLSFSYFKGSKKLNSEYCIIKNDNLKFRNGLTLRYFKNQSEIKKAFSKKFKNFIFGSVEDDCFGWNNNCHLVICQKK